MSRPTAPARIPDVVAKALLRVGSIRVAATAKTARVLSAYSGGVVANITPATSAIPAIRPISRTYLGSSDTSDSRRPARAVRNFASAKRPTKVPVVALRRDSRNPLIPGIRAFQASRSPRAISCPIPRCTLRRPRCRISARSAKNPAASTVASGETKSSTTAMAASVNTSGASERHPRMTCEKDCGTAVASARWISASCRCRCAQYGADT